MISHGALYSPLHLNDYTCGSSLISTFQPLIANLYADHRVLDLLISLSLSAGNFPIPVCFSFGQAIATLQNAQD
jgi:hypothetical protein